VPESTRPLRLTLELDAHAEPIHGTIADMSGHTRQCVGWLAFIGAVEEMRQSPAPPTVEGRSTPEGEE
jgi:hypothetical protein